MRIDGEHRGVKWSADVRVVVEVGAPGRMSAAVGRGYGEWPSEDEIRAFAASVIDTRVDGLPPLEEARTIGPGDVEPAKPKRKR